MATLKVTPNRALVALSTPSAAANSLTLAGRSTLRSGKDATPATGVTVVVPESLASPDPAATVTVIGPVAIGSVNPAPFWTATRNAGFSVPPTSTDVG